ncbi:MAG: hypothetical protein R3C49_18955 [Planctomycetaceae bacterium]
MLLPELSNERVSDAGISKADVLNVSRFSRGSMALSVRCFPLMVSDSNNGSEQIPATPLSVTFFESIP